MHTEVQKGPKQSHPTKYKLLHIKITLSLWLAAVLTELLYNFEVSEFMSREYLP